MSLSPVPPVNYLTIPVGKLAIPVEPIHAFNSVQSAAAELQDTSVPGIPVIENGVYIGIFTENDIARALALDLPPSTPVKDLITTAPPPIRGYESAAQALRYFLEHQSECLAVTDDFNRVIGIIIPSRLINTAQQGIRPRMVGGMATPLGVYLTSGSTSGGVPKFALLLTGATMLGIFLTGQYIALFASKLLPSAVRNVDLTYVALDILGLLTFFLLLRALPLSGYHGAEHMVVHAIEQGEPLEPEVVRRMPRVHPRCGTNLAVGAMIFLGIWSAPLAIDPELRLLLAFLITSGFYRPVGSFVQYYLTTKTPTDQQLKAGIAAGKDLLLKYQTAGQSQAGFLTRLVNSGIFHIMAGSMIAALIVVTILTVLRVPSDWVVISLS